MRIRKGQGGSDCIDRRGDRFCRRAEFRGVAMARTKRSDSGRSLVSCLKSRLERKTKPTTSRSPALWYRRDRLRREAVRSRVSKKTDNNNSVYENSFELCERTTMDFFVHQQTQNLSRAASQPARLGIYVGSPKHGGRCGLGLALAVVVSCACVGSGTESAGGSRL